jgi:hypothetical protein
MAKKTGTADDQKRDRDAFEQAASAKHQRGLQEDNGAVIVQLGDLKSSSL